MVLKVCINQSKFMHQIRQTLGHTCRWGWISQNLNQVLKLHWGRCWVDWNWRVENWRVENWRYEGWRNENWWISFWWFGHWRDSYRGWYKTYNFFCAGWNQVYFSPLLVLFRPNGGESKTKSLTRFYFFWSWIYVFFTYAFDHNYPRYKTAYNRTWTNSTNRYTKLRSDKDSARNRQYFRNTFDRSIPAGNYSWMKWNRRNTRLRFGKGSTRRRNRLKNKNLK